jgi:ribosomal protein L7/L12
MWDRIRKLFGGDNDTLDKVRAYEEEQARARPHASRPPSSARGAESTRDSEGSAAGLATIQTHIQARRTIEAIKAYRELYPDTGLKEAKEAVEAMEAGRWTPPIEPAGAASSAGEGDSVAAIRALLLAGNKIEAIKAYRERYGVGLKEAKDQVEAIERGVWQSPAAPSTVSDAPEIEHLLLAGQKIEAIKRYREQHGVGLKEAKDAIDALERTLRGR